MVRIMRPLAVVAIICGLSGWGLGAGAAASELKVDQFTLENGMQVVVVPDHRAPIVTHMVWYRVGGADEPEGVSGIAHFLEHLMFKRTDTLEDGEFSRIVANNGGQHNAFTSYDYTAYYQDVAADRLDLMMSLEADRMVNLNLKPEDIATERDVIIEERRMRLDNSPSALLREQMSAVQFVAHPYGTPLIGWLDEMRGLTLDDALEFYRRFYNPANAILVVAGDVTTDQVRTLAEKYYGVIPGHELPARVRRAEPEPVAERRVKLIDSRVRQAVWQRSYLAPSYHRGKTEYAIPLSVLAQILGGGSTSRLYRDLVVEKNLATSAGAGYSPSAYDLSTFYVYAVPVAGADQTEAIKASDATEAAVEKVLAEILANGVNEEELTRAKANLVAAAIYARDDVSDLANIFGRALTVGQSVEDVLAWSDNIKAVTAEDVVEAARYVLQSQKSVVGLLLPEAARGEP